MNWEEYKILSEKTLSTEFHCTKDDELLLHAIIGILTEMEELLDNYMGGTSDDVNISEEIFDAAWYLAIIGRKYNLETNFSNVKVESSLQDPLLVILNIIKTSLKLLDFMKKKLYYNKPINQDLVVKYSNEISSLFVVYCSLNNISIESGFDVNIAKLKARYGEKFTSEKAINRDLVTERIILEGDTNTSKI
jgi:hypothetical protein